MVRKGARAPLAVYLNGRRVGTFRRERTGAVDFRYAQEWLNWDNAIPVSLSLPLREDRYLGDPVFAVFDNLLPDSNDVRRRLAERTGAEGDDAFSLLSAIGRDCVGALQFLPEDAALRAAGAVDGRRVSEAEIEQIIANLARQPLGLGDDQDFRISIAGAQEKTALLYWKRHWYIPHGTTATTHIVKPEMGLLPNGIDMRRSVENEHFCLRFVSELGLAAAKTEIADFGERRVLVVERFDRIWNSRPPLAACAAGGSLSGSLGPAEPQISGGRWSFHSGYRHAPARKRQSGCRSQSVLQNTSSVLASRRHRRPCKEFQYPPLAGRPFPDDPALRHHVGAASIGCRSNPP